MKHQLIASLILASAACGAELPREPAALAVSGELLLVGNRRSGTVCWIDTRTSRVMDERPAAKSVSQLAPWGDGVLVLDELGAQLLQLGSDSREARPLMELPAGAARLSVDFGRREILIAAKWSRTVVILHADSPAGATPRRADLSLPFAPGELLPLARAGHPSIWLVADAFGGNLAVVDAAAPKIVATHRLHGHNIRGLAVDEEGADVLVAHQKMAAPAVADYEELHWGRLISNTVQAIDVEALLEPNDGRLAGWEREHGGIGGAAGDPSALLAGAGLLATAFSGVGEVCVERPGRVKRLTVGSHPAALARAGGKLFVANRFDDSVSVIDLDRLEVVDTIRLGQPPASGAPKPQLSAEDRGARLFYDATLSHQGWMSCHSCHTDGHAADLLVDTLGDGGYGAPKRVPSLLGTAETGPWGWTGGSRTLEQQVSKSVETTMHGRPLTPEQASDLAAFVRSLQLPAAPASDALANRGRRVFHSQSCAECHAPPRHTSDALFDVGTRDKQGRTRFNPPSLRGVRHRSRLLHDGRASSLHELLTKHRHPARQQAKPLHEEQLKALLAYLKTL